MPTVAWIYRSPDPLASGELRRLGLPALAIEGGAWRSRFVRLDQIGALEADVAVVPLNALEALPALAGAGAPAIVVEIDDAAAEHGDALQILAGMSGRVAAVAARGPAGRLAARAALGPATPIWIIPDAADTLAELKAAAIRHGVPMTGAASPGPPPRGGDLWFADPGDRLDDDEIEQLALLWREPSEAPRVAIAPPQVLEWLSQAGARATYEATGAAALDLAFGAASRCVVPAGPQPSRQRRRRKAHRHALGLIGEGRAEDVNGDPRSVAVAWRSSLGRLAETRAPRGAAPVAVMVFMDLVQDLDLALPLIDQILARPDAVLRVVVTNWLEERSPRVSAELEARGIVADVVQRTDVLSGAGPSLAGVDALISVVETSDPAHARAHALFRQARAAGVPTFSLQHGVENVGLTYFDGPQGETRILSDHLFTWFDAGRAPEATPADLRPRLVPVGRPGQDAKTTDLRAVFAGFQRLVAVFENLHWDRYDETYRRRFLDDCAEFAQATPDAAVLIKPHHAGMWSAKNRAAFPQWGPNLVMADPSDPFWEPFTAPSLIAAADLVITTPSTVALDAALARKPVAVVAYGMDLPAFAPLPLLQSGADWIAFGAQGQAVGAARRRAEFVARTTRPGVAETAAVGYVIQVARGRTRAAAQG
jgi:hypothetical protein